MAGVTIKTIEKKEVWENFLRGRGDASFLQSWYWGEFEKELGKRIARVGFYQGGRLSGVMLAIVEDARRGRHLVVPAGPVINWKDKGLVLAFVNTARRIAKDYSCTFVRVRPQLLANEFSRQTFVGLGFKAAPMHLHAQLTHQLDITKSKEELLSSMRKSTRYEIRKAINLGIEVEKSFDPDDIDSFYNLQLETARRQGFVPFSREFLQKQFEIFAKEGLACLFTAKYKQEVLNQAFVIFYGREAVYHYGASSPAGREYPGAFIVQWEAICEAKRRGLGIYNFWGVAPLDKKSHRFYNLSIFKRGFGGVDVEYLPAQDLIIDRKRYLVNFLVETVRKKFRGLDR